MYTSTALKIYTAIRDGVIKSRASFWRDFSSIDKLNSLNIDFSKYENKLSKAKFDIVCCFDDDFPIIDKSVPLIDKPFFLAYQGDLNLIKDISKNVAVIGVLSPNENIIKRERHIVTSLVQNGICILSGLAKGCDSVAHNECLARHGKTVVILPSTLDDIYPPENAGLAQSIVDNDGLILTEYVTEPKSYHESISRLIDRDRLQAMFSKSVILIASYRKGEGDSGSRHAMSKAKTYKRRRYIMYNHSTDNSKPIFGLNEELIVEDVKILTTTSIKDLIE